MNNQNDNAKKGFDLKYALPVFALTVLSLISLARVLQLRSRNLELEQQTEELRRELQVAINKAPVIIAKPGGSPAKAALDADETSEVSGKEQLLFKEVATLRDLLADKDRVIRELERNNRGRQPREADAEGDADARRAAWAERMQRFREENPERFQEMEARRQEFQERMQAQAQRQQNFLASMDPAKMTPEQRKDYQRLNELLGKQQELTEAINVDPRGEGTNILRQDLVEVSREARELLTRQRDVAFQDLARQLGYQDTQVQQFAEYLNDIVQSTSGGGLMTGRGGAPGGAATEGGRRGNRERR